MFNTQWGSVELFNDCTSIAQSFCERAYIQIKLINKKNNTGDICVHYWYDS